MLLMLLSKGMHSIQYLRHLINHTRKRRIYIITICKQPFGANFFTRCLAPKTCTFGRRNMHVWQAKHVRLAGETCTFGRRKMYVWQAKRARLAGETCTFGRRNMYVWQAKHARLAGERCTFGRRNMHS